MKRCVTTHDAAGFGTIPAGSLWDDDSPYITDDNADCFVDDVRVVADVELVEFGPVRKFGEKPGGDD